MRISRSTGALSGLLLVILGLWGGLVPFIGPYFGYAFGTHATWDYTANRLWLDILPGAAVVLGGLIMMQSGHRVSGTVGCWLAMAGGAWFAVGPAVSRLWEHSAAGPIGAPLYGTTRQVFELVGYYYGLGVVIVGLAAFALGRFVTRPPIVAAPAAQEPAAAPTAEPYEPVNSESDERVPSESQSGEPVPAESQSGERVPAESQSGQRVPAESQSGQRVPAESGSSQWTRTGVN